MRFLLFLAFVFPGLVVSAVEPMDSDVLMTRSLQQAIDSVASLPGGGVVRLDAGVYCTGTLRLKSGVRLHLERGATVLGSINPYDYDGYDNETGNEAGGVADKCSKPQFALIVARDCHGVAITGEGTIDGRGLDVALAIDSLHHTGKRIDPHYNMRRMRPSLRPKLLDFEGVDTLLVEGVNLRASASWGFSLSKCSDVTIRDIDFVNRAYWNNDGIDVADCYRVEITGCIIHLSDMPARVSSPTMLLISSTLSMPRARLWRMVEVMRLERSLSITVAKPIKFSWDRIKMYAHIIA